MVGPDRSTTTPSAVDLADAEDLQSAIANALAAQPIDDDILRRSVWTFVRAQRDVGMSPGHVIIALTALVEGAPLGAVSVRHSRLRQVTLSCVEAYFGHLGGNEVSGEFAAPIGPRRASNR